MSLKCEKHKKSIVGMVGFELVSFIRIAERFKPALYAMSP